MNDHTSYYTKEGMYLCVSFFSFFFFLHSISCMSPACPNSKVCPVIFYSLNNMGNNQVTLNNCADLNSLMDFECVRHMIGLCYPWPCFPAAEVLFIWKRRRCQREIHWFMYSIQATVTPRIDYRVHLIEWICSDHLRNLKVYYLAHIISNQAVHTWLTALL